MIMMMFSACRGGGSSGGGSRRLWLLAHAHRPGALLSTSNSKCSCSSIRSTATLSLSLSLSPSSFWPKQQQQQQEQQERQEQGGFLLPTRPLLSLSLLSSSSLGDTTTTRSVRNFSTSSTSLSLFDSILNPPPPPSGASAPPPALCKIVATIGPTSEEYKVLSQLTRAGLSIMRLNFSHATVEEVELRTTNLQKSQASYGAALDSVMEQGMDPSLFASSSSSSSSSSFDNTSNNKVENLRGVLLDTKGPEIRTGTLRNDTSGKETVYLEPKSHVTLYTTEKYKVEGSTATNLFVDYPLGNLHSHLSRGNQVLLDDGALVLTVVDSTPEGIVCVVETPGHLRSRAGVFLPGVATPLPALSEKDRVDIRYGLSLGVDYVAASFVQTAQGVRDIRQYMRQVLDQDETKNPQQGRLPLLLSKIESRVALQNFDEILAESDGIMVARGDLGVEISLPEVTVAQMEMVAACRAVGKPVIVATQMMESMTNAPQPTRAEVADVTWAVWQGADAVMTSGETAKGQFPVETIQCMQQIVRATEAHVRGRQQQEQEEGGKPSGSFMPAPPSLSLGQDSSATTFTTTTIRALARAAATAARETNAKALVFAFSPQESPIEEELVRQLAATCGTIPICVYCNTAAMARRLVLYRAVFPILASSDNKKQQGQGLGFYKSGDVLVEVQWTPNDDKDKEEEGMGQIQVQTA